MAYTLPKSNTKPYVVLSDIHCHAWSLFSKIENDGVNSRLRIILNEWERAADELIKAGGYVMVITGDIFHVRGAVDPEVLNPVRATIKKIMDMGITIVAIPGNHDLKGNDTTELGSMVQNLSEVYSDNGSFTVFNEVKIWTDIDDEYLFGFVPWKSSKKELIDALLSLKSAVGNKCDQMDVFIHAGIDGVLPGVPPHGLNDVELAKIGFRRVMAGDYHNHKDFGNGVFSVGATTHQTWRDIGSRAGFMLCNAHGQCFIDTHAPKFIDVSGEDEEDIKLLVDGNYARFRGSQMNTEEMKELREFFEKHGALGTSLQVPVSTSSKRQGVSPVKAGQTLDQSVTGFADKMELKPDVDRDAVKKVASEVLKRASAVYEDS